MIARSTRRSNNRTLRLRTKPDVGARPTGVPDRPRRLRRSWMCSGAAMGVREAYNQWAPTYDSDRNLTRDLDELVTRSILADMQCASILELGCGTGKNTAFLAQLGAHVHALDFSDAMLAQAQAKLPHAHVTFTITDLMGPWPCADQSADLIVCNLVLEHIADLHFIFAEAFRC